MRRSTRLRRLLDGPGTGVLVEAHNGLTAKLVEEAGFEAIWASGLALSASMGVRDNNELSPSQVTDLLEFMVDSASIPILLDGDTGYGNFNNVRRLVQKLERIGVAGVCLEDKLFPKTNSFIAGEQQPLAESGEFCGKLKAAKDVQRDPDFVVVARTEALIAGWGLEEALRRAHAYADAGADAVLVHSRCADAGEIRSFAERWTRRTPIVAVPTTYADTPFDVFQEIGVGAVIWANQVLRAVVSGVQATLARLRQTRDLGAIDREIAPMQEIFRLQDAAEIREAERRYLPMAAPRARAILLAASQGAHFGNLTADKPKCMIPVWGKPILSHTVSSLNEVGIKDIAAVVGYCREAVDLPGLRTIENPDYERTGSLASLRAARSEIDGECVISYADILYEPAVLRELLETPGDVVLAVDTSWCQGEKAGRPIDAVVGADRPSPRYRGTRTSAMLEIGPHIPRSRADGEWIGVLKASAEGARELRVEVERFAQEAEDQFLKASLTDLLSRVVARGCEVRVLYVSGRWFDVDSIEDLSEAYRSAI